MTLKATYGFQGIFVSAFVIGPFPKSEQFGSSDIVKVNLPTFSQATLKLGTNMKYVRQDASWEN